MQSSPSNAKTLVWFAPRNILPAIQLPQLTSDNFIAYAATV